ncbi:MULTISPECIES: twin transmembrane helix small protein [Stappiaceae]|uniref:Twin transmembrane helix small protein n=1 Tax=Roseibium polysiphoniae TaxID=2571221 RepID=A0A927KBW8_9HYPH|nr:MULTISPECIES: twin transmembrane helix small protein [Stappiaceae]MBD8877545.1 twin transmembrane helix small protein [Roseibium polysiphoniae]MBS8261765.1 twin transmembrane helix small protein [Roseibium polysiphoniae]
MVELWNILVPLGMAAVAVVLVLGIWNMVRGGPGNRSQMFMRWRVGLQFLVVLLVMGGLYLFGPVR